MEKIKTFYSEYEDMLEEYLDTIKRDLKNSNEEYAKLQKEFDKILDRNENLTWILEGKIEDKNLSNAECFSLAKVVQNYSKMQILEEKELFFFGIKEAYFLFKKLGILL